MAQFVECLGGVIAWDEMAIERSTRIKKELNSVSYFILRLGTVFPL